MPRLFLELRIHVSRCRVLYAVALCAFVGTVWLALSTAAPRDGEVITYTPPVATAPAIVAAAADDGGTENYGWAGPAAVADLADWINAQPEFELVDERGQRVWQDNASADVRLWQAIAHAGGEYPPDDYQLTGDCTSWGGSNAITATQGGQAARGEAIEIKRPFPPALYAARVHVWAEQIGGVRRLPSAGCTGAAVARMAQEFGVLPDDTPGLPTYTRQTADQWGRTGIPAEFLPIAAQHKVRTVARVTTTAQARDALCNFYGVTIASDWGNPGHKYVKQDGRWVARRTGQWMHQMCVDGYDGSSSSGRKYFHVQNSWPKSQHPAPIDDSPAGGFWIDESELAYILRQNDSWAFSDFEGFPARNRDLDLSRLRSRRRPASTVPPKGSVP